MATKRGGGTDEITADARAELDSALDELEVTIARIRARLDTADRGSDDDG